MNPSSPEIDLPRDLCRRVETVYARLAASSHYDVLEVAKTADRRAISKAYLERTLEFQSTRYFNLRLGKYRAMMDAIYARVTDAYDTLMSPYKRAEYDRSSQSARLASVEAMLEAEVMAMRGDDGSFAREVVARPSQRPPIANEPPRTKSGVQARVTAPDTRVRSAK